MGEGVEPARHQTILVLDFGGQYTQLIARRVRENRVYCEIHPYDVELAEIEAMAPIGIVLSGGPDSVYAAGAPLVAPELFSLGIPILGICYGMQLTAHLLGGEVQAAAQREYGRTEIELVGECALFAGLEPRQTVWMSHGDRIETLPDGFVRAARTDNAPTVACEHRERRIWGIQFHPEVVHTVHGGDMLRNFLYRVCGAEGSTAFFFSRIWKKAGAAQIPLAEEEER